MEYWSDGVGVVLLVSPTHYSNIPLLQYSSFLLGHHVDLRLDVASRDDMPFEVHLIGVKT
jgi:hypothetical protein